MITAAEDEFGPDMTPPPNPYNAAKLCRKNLALYQVVTKSSLFKPWGRSYFMERERKQFAGANASDGISGLSARAGNEMGRYARRFHLWRLSR
jgi:hypothetical protein